MQVTRRELHDRAFWDAGRTPDLDGRQFSSREQQVDSTLSDTQESRNLGDGR